MREDAVAGLQPHGPRVVGEAPGGQDLTAFLEYVRTHEVDPVGPGRGGVAGAHHRTERRRSGQGAAALDEITGAA
ncbi:hypothetical protein ABZX75_07740 [Streptomyces sp. NPDC003038]|uniref:hypothetical protein n=1 Tax=Streptomyces sp. NPDC003038 TaxID=3154546 RepID=UPI0033BDAD61